MYIIQMRSPGPEGWIDEESYNDKKKAIEEIKKKRHHYQYRLIKLISEEEYIEKYN